ncbi:MAG: ABC transporter substrate-binding protein [Gammaproteobacteria bacterium]|nr:ABC transporter substrate-binding protein [Gammaproteobacteria bacterium]
MRYVISMILLAASLSGTAHAEELKIGAAVSMTGSFAYADVPAVEGMQVAIDELNENGGIAGKYPIKLDIKDGRSDPAQTVIAAEELLSDGAHVLILPADADPAIGAGLQATEAKTPAFTTVASSPTLPLSAGEYVFGNFPADNLQTTASAEYARDMGYETAYLLYSPDSSYTQLPLYFKDVFEELGGEVVGEGVYNLGQQNFSAIVTKIEAMDPQPDVIMTAAYEPDFPAFIKQLRAAGVEIPVIGSDGIDSATTFSLGDVVEGVVFTTAGFAQDGNALSEFYAAYEEKFGREAETIYTALGYDIINIIEAAVKEAGTLDGESLRDAIAGLSGLEGVVGKITYAGTDRAPLREVTIVRIEDGERVLVSQGVPDGSLVPDPEY